MNGEDGLRSTPLAQSLLAKVQLGLPGTVTRLGSKMRFIDQLAPLLREGGVIRSVRVKQPLNIRAAGIATDHKTIPAFGGLLYCAGAVRQDIYVENGSVYHTYQDSVVDIDEVDDIDVPKKLKFVHILQTYKLLEELIQEEDKPHIVMVDSPLILEHNDVPLDSQYELKRYYQQCLEAINLFWTKHQDKIYPFNKDGIYLVSLNNKRFGAIFYGLVADKRQYIIDEIEEKVFSNIAASFDKIRRVGVKKMLNGVLSKRSRTAAYEYDILTERNRIEPKIVQDLGLSSFHVRAGLNTMPIQVEMVGTGQEWNSNDLDEIASLIVSLITVDQPKALPLPLWYAKYALKPIESGQVLHYFKSQAREMIKNEEVENIWKEELDIFEEGTNG